MSLKNKIKKLVFLFKKQQQQSEVFFTKDFFKNEKFNIGEFTYGKPKVLFVNGEANLTIGKYCSIASNVTIFLGGNHRVDWFTTYPFSALNKEFPEAKNIVGHPKTKGNVIIGNDVWIGQNVTILSGVTIGDGAVLAANSIITKNVGSYEIWAGNPAKLVKSRFTPEIKARLLELKWWNWSSEKIIKNIEHLCSNNIDNLK